MRKVFILLLILPFLITSLWCILFGFFVGYLSIVLLLFGCYRYWSSMRKMLLLTALWFVVNLVFLPFTINQYNTTTSNYFKRIQKGEVLTIRENCSIYGLNIFMAAGAYILFPEVSKETFLMMFPAKERTFNNDFFLKSKKIRLALNKHPNDKKVYVSWKPSDYLDVFSGEARIAYALNPCYVYRQADGILSAEIKVSYPARAHTLLVPFPIKIYVEEGLFHYLEKIHWLYPYKVIYLASSSSN